MFNVRRSRFVLPMRGVRINLQMLPCPISQSLAAAMSRRQAARSLGGCRNAKNARPLRGEGNLSQNSLKSQLLSLGQDFFSWAFGDLSRAVFKSCVMGLRRSLASG